MKRDIASSFQNLVIFRLTQGLYPVYRAKEERYRVFSEKDERNFGGPTPTKRRLQNQQQHAMNHQAPFQTNKGFYR